MLVTIPFQGLAEHSKYSMNKEPLVDWDEDPSDQSLHSIFNCWNVLVPNMVFLLLSSCRLQKNKGNNITILKTDPKNGGETHKYGREVIGFPCKFLPRSAQRGRSEAKFRFAAQCHPIPLGTSWQLPQKLGCHPIILEVETVGYLSIVLDHLEDTFG